MTDKLKQFLEAVDYRVTDGYNFMWKCYGDNAYAYNSDNDAAHYSATIIFDTKTQEIYESTICDTKNNRAYRIIHPAYRVAHAEESEENNIGQSEAWEGVDYVDLEVVDDFAEKFKSIVTGETYDTRVSVPLELDNETMFQLMTAAHNADMSLNQFVENLLKRAIDERVI